MEPRKPTQEEKEQLIQYLWLENYVHPTDEEEEQERNFVENAAIAVFDDYVTDSPVYAGKVMVVVWRGSPSQCQVYIWIKGRVEEIGRD